MGTDGIRVKFFGKALGLDDGRLSLEAFGDALPLLLKAFRGVMTQLRTGEAGASGRFSQNAREIDVQILSIDHNCLSIDMTPVAQIEAFTPEDIEHGIDAFLDCLAGESRGERKNARVRSFLKKLPVTIAKQEWFALRAGQVVRQVDIGTIELSDEEPDLTATLGTLTGRIAGVEFEPTPKVRLLRMGSKTVTIEATTRLVHDAIMLQGKEVLAKVVSVAGKGRLLWIRDAGETQPSRSIEEIDKLISDSWKDTLARLAT